MDPTIVTHTFPPAGMPEPPTPMQGSAAVEARAAVDAMAGRAGATARGPDRTIAEAAAMAHRAVDGAAGAATPFASWLAEHGGDLESMQKKLLADTCKYVSANPLTAVGIAVAAGFVVSRLIR